MSITITKGKLLKGDKVEADYIKKGRDGKPAKCSQECSSPPHKDLKIAFANLAVHAAVIGFFIPASNIKDISAPDNAELENFTVTGFSMVGAEGAEGVILTAHKKLPNGKVLPFNTPITRFGDQSEHAYTFIDDLLESVEACRSEIKSYLTGKFAEDTQGVLFPEPLEEAKPSEDDFPY
jgi:hypothetical protein